MDHLGKTALSWVFPSTFPRSSASTMTRLLLLPPSVYRTVLPLLGLTLLPLPLSAGNQHGPGWQQAKSKPKAGGPTASPASAGPRAGRVPDLPPDAPRRAVPTEDMVQRVIPGSGPLKEDDLIRLAIANDVTLARRRSEVLISQAKAKGAGDWENPELRIGYVWDQDERLQEPFSESATQTITANERYLSSENQRNLAPEFFPGAGDRQFQRTTGSVRSSRYRTIETKVTPGRYRDIVNTTVYEQRRSADTFRQDTADTTQEATVLKNEAGSQNTSRRIVERSREVINHPDDFANDDEFNILIRFRLPHPWERRAKLQLAAAETARAESDYLIEEDKVVRTVRALYEELNMAENISRSTASRSTLQNKFRQEVEAANSPDLADLAADLRLESGKTLRDQRELRSDIARLREELATYCGLDQPQRIASSSQPARRMVSTDSLDVDYLISMAQLHRSDLLDLQARMAVAKAELMGAKAAKIPFVTFFDAGWATSQTTGRTGENEEWSVRAGISLPFFDWLGINKAHLEHRAATESYSRLIEEQRRLVANEIRQAITRIRTAARELTTYEKDLARIREDSQRSLTESAVDPIKSYKNRYQSEDLVSKFEEDRYEVWSDYYKAVIELERALGTRLERVLSR